MVFKILKYLSNTLKLYLASSTSTGNVRMDVPLSLVLLYHLALQVTGTINFIHSMKVVFEGASCLTLTNQQQSCYLPNTVLKCVPTVGNRWVVQQQCGYDPTSCQSLGISPCTYSAPVGMACPTVGERCTLNERIIMCTPMNGERYILSDVFSTSTIPQCQTPVQPIVVDAIAGSLCTGKVGQQCMVGQKLFTCFFFGVGLPTGYLDSATTTLATGKKCPSMAQVLGWMINLASPFEVVTVNVIVDGQVHATGTTNIPREDVRVLYKNPQPAGFSISLHITSPGQHTVSVVAVTAQVVSTKGFLNSAGNLPYWNTANSECVSTLWSMFGRICGLQCSL